MQKNAKKTPINASVVKNALRWRSHFGRVSGPILGSERPKRAKMSPKEPSGASKNQKPSFSKTLKNPRVFLKVFGYRGLSRKPQEAEEGSQKAPKKSKTPKNRNPKLNPKIIKKNWNQFWIPIFWGLGLFGGLLGAH